MKASAKVKATPEGESPTTGMFKGPCYGWQIAFFFLILNRTFWSPFVELHGR